jgi:surface carbohydrate biosynthesis protein
MIRQVYIPIEVKNRELKSRLLVLYFLLKKGHKCIIGDKAGVYRYMINNPGGIYYDKSISKNKIAFIKKIKKIARHFVCSDEELGITYNNIESFFKFRVCLPTLTETTSFYCCGDRDYNYLIGKYSKQKNKFKLTGSAQFDMIKPGFCEFVYSDEINKIKLKYGEFVLINSSFGIISEESVRYNTNLALKLKRISKEQYNEKFDELYERYKGFISFVDLVNKLSKDFPRLKFIIRPHPKEYLKDWSKLVNNNGNIFVIKENDVIPWIYASQVMIHTGCTTAIYANLLKKKIISYSSKLANSRNSNLAQSFGFQAKNYSDIKKGLTDLHVHNNELNPSILKVLKISDLEFCSDSIAEEISNLKTNITKVSFYMKIYYKYLIFLNFISRKKIKYISGESLNDKIPDGIHIDEITSFLNNTSAFFSNEFKFTIKSIDKNTFKICKQSR